VRGGGGVGAASLGVWSPTFRSSVMISEGRAPSNAAQQNVYLKSAFVVKSGEQRDLRYVTACDQTTKQTTKKKTN